MSTLFWNYGKRYRNEWWNSLLHGIIFGPDGGLLGKLRKLKPTATERVIFWGREMGAPFLFLILHTGR